MISKRTVSPTHPSYSFSWVPFDLRGRPSFLLYIVVKRYFHNGRERVGDGLPRWKTEKERLSRFCVRNSSLACNSIDTLVLGDFNKSMAHGRIARVLDPKYRRILGSVVYIDEWVLQWRRALFSNFLFYSSGLVASCPSEAECSRWTGDGKIIGRRYRNCSHFSC